MTRRQFIHVAAGSAVLPWQRLAAQQRERPPNVVLIYADDLGYGDVSCYGATKVRTPNIDRLAAEGRVFTDAHSAAAVCTPSRYCLLTGQYAWRIGNWSPVFLQHPLLIDPERLTVPRLLKDAGYRTACIGKWHLGFGTTTWPDWNKALKPGPLEVGFDYYFGVPVVNSHPPFVYVEDHHVVGLDPDDPLRWGPGLRTPSRPYPEKNAIPRKTMPSVAGGERAHALYVDEDVCTTLTGKAIDWLRGQSTDTPFFLYVATTNIHHPFTPHPRFHDTSDCGRYGDFIHELDWAVGEILRTLDETGMADQTLVVFTSDNGGMLNQGGRQAWDMGHRLNGELLGFKFGAWEGGHRIPFIARWPGRIPAGSRSDQLIANIDLLATLAALLGRPLTQDEGPDSFNQLPTLTGAPRIPVRDHLLIAPHMKTHLSIRSGRWVYIPRRGSGGFGNGFPSFAKTRSVNSDVTPEGRVKPDAPQAQLYDLKADLRQARNVIREHPDVAADLQDAIERYRNQGYSAR